jgi:hypothetical protein
MTWLRTGQFAVTCESGEEPSGSTEREEFLASRGTISFSKKRLCSVELIARKWMTYESTVTYVTMIHILFLNPQVIKFSAIVRQPIRDKKEVSLIYCSKG